MSDTIAAQDDPMHPMGALRILRRRWIWILVGALPVLALGILPILKRPNHVGFVTIEAVEDYTITRTLYLSAFRNREPLGLAISSGSVAVDEVANSPSRHTFIIEAPAAESVASAQKAITKAALEIEGDGRERDAMTWRSRLNNTVQRIAAYRELQQMLTTAINRENADVGDSPSTLLDIAGLVLPLEIQRADLEANPVPDQPRITVTSSEVLRAARPVRTILIGVLGSALAAGLLLAVLVDAVSRVRKSIWTR